MSSRVKTKGLSTQPTSVVSVRLTDDEKTALKHMAGQKGLSTYLRDKALDGVVGSARRVPKPKPGPNTRLLSELLACLGRKGLSDNLRRIAEAAERGALQFDPDAARNIQSACDDIAVMRWLLLKGLGLRTPAPANIPKESVSMHFTRAAAPYAMDDGGDDEDWLT
jgi:hypothetical protein